MAYEVVYTRQALKILRGLPRNLAGNIQAKISQLATAPEQLAANIKKLAGREGYRLRVGDFRVIYTLDNGRMLITVIAIGSRGGIYDA